MALNKYLISGLAATAIVATVGLAYAQTGGSPSGTTGQGPVSQDTQPAGSSSPATQPSATDPSNMNNTTGSPSPSGTDSSTTTPSGSMNMTEPAPQADRN
jgi:hypothetical protein